MLATVAAWPEPLSHVICYPLDQRLQHSAQCLQRVNGVVGHTVALSGLIVGCLLLKFRIAQTTGVLKKFGIKFTCVPRCDHAVTHSSVSRRRDMNAPDQSLRAYVQSSASAVSSKQISNFNDRVCQCRQSIS